MALLPLSPFAGRGPSQVGILVEDMEQALARYARVWGPREWRCFVYTPDTVPTLTYRGRPGTFEITIAITDTVPQIELVQPSAGPSIYEERLAEHGEGLHHLGFRVDSLAAAAAEVEAAGYEIVQAGGGYGLDGDGGFAYLDTARELGVMLELIEVPKRRRRPDFVWPSP